MTEPGPDETFDYVVVGSGAGGGPLAANLARAGKRVLLLEAGGEEGGANYEVPLFHALATEDPLLRWDYFVHHYSDAERERRDPKYVAERDGVLYPRAGTLGGCTAHNAMITLYPHNADWDAIADATGDPTWRSDRMRHYFQRLEHCDHRQRPRSYPRNRVLSAIVHRLAFVDSFFFANGARHGFDGWLHTDFPPADLAFKDAGLFRTVAGAAKRALEADLGRALRVEEGLSHFFDPNAWRTDDKKLLGLWRAPLATNQGRRNGTRERILDTAREHPGGLVVRTGALATRVVLDDDRRAVAVEYVEGRHLYRADPNADGEGELPPVRRANVSAEVILSCGAFNTPQLLKLSGIGPAAELIEHGIEVKLDLPGVGENLQDRYEVGVVSKLTGDSTLLRGARWRAPIAGEQPDDQYAEWLEGKGAYTTNGVALAVIRNSGQSELPDLFLFALPSYFKGYFPDYSDAITDQHDKFTWAVLKAHTDNRAGSVRLRSADPRDTPLVDFRYFDEGDGGGGDLDAVVDGVKFARRLMADMSEQVERECVPGPEIQTDDELRGWVADNAWGHHASCSAKMGPGSDPMAVVGSDFRVHGIEGLRVVDASVFPRIPGFFIVTAVYMISEKASDVILAAASSTIPRRAREIMATAKGKSTKPVSGSGYRNTLPWRVFNGATQALDRAVGWDRLPKPLGLAVLVGVRNILRQKNLHDTSQIPSTGAPDPGPFEPAYRTSRTTSGAHNDLHHPGMGMAQTRFARNVPLDKVNREPDDRLLDPSPRLISRRLLTRDPFQPATTVNTLACTWLQFMIKDWFSHGQGDMAEAWAIELEPGDEWHENPMRIPRTIADPTRPPGSPGPVTFLNADTHWWDGSQIYGTNAEQAQFVRSGKDGKLAIGPTGRAPLPDDPAMNPANVPGWWLGLSLMRTIFTLEHNSICDRLRAEYPTWPDETLFQRARLINAALLAKIHTVEWTPAVISHPTTVAALRANWFGVLGEKFFKAFGRVVDDEVLSGIPGSEANHYGAEYALTEEFAAVYRMHPLIPDDYSFRHVSDDSLVRDMGFGDLTGPAAETVQDELGLDDVLYSLGTSHPGVVTMHNYPRFLQDFVRPDGKHHDIAATDVLRIREAGVPRYNEFRRLLHLKPAEDFDALTTNPRWAQELREVYGDIERVDLMVGMYAERLPQGFAFSDTAFRIFVLMASRRLNSDRFLTRDFNAEVYTSAGMAWLKDNTMRTVLLRHYPALAGAMGGVENAFAPWRKAGGAA